MHTWDPQRYLAFGDERARPFGDLLARIGADRPTTVVDLGCGPGNLTALLARRWPDAEVVGIDASPAMVAAARTAAPGLRFVVADLRAWAHGRTPTATPHTAGAVDADAVDTDDAADTEDAADTAHVIDAGGAVDVIVSSATLQWVPGHLELLSSLVGRLAPGGWLAFQVPGNFGEPSHTIRTELASQEPYAAHLRDVAVPSSHDPLTYLETLEALGCQTEVWETTYFHVLTGDDPVFTWVSGTGARPTLQALPDDLRTRFEATFKRRLAAAYPARDGRVVLPFRRIFAVARATSTTG